jgi:hypothetical protein
MCIRGPNVLKIRATRTYSQHMLRTGYRHMLRTMGKTNTITRILSWKTHLHPGLFVVGIAHGLSNALALVVARTGTDRVDIAKVCLYLWMNL